MDSAAPPGLHVSPTREKGETEARDEGSTVGKSDTFAEVKKTVPNDVLTTSTPLWEDFVVGKFLDITPHVAKVHMVLNKIWKYGDSSTKVDVYEVNTTTMRFRVTNLKAREKAREKILKRSMWNIAGVPMIVTKWTPRSEEEKQEEEAVPMWVHPRGVPLDMYSWEGLSFITSAVGFPVKLHPETIACTNFEVAKVFVKVDVSKVLPQGINFSKNVKEFVVGFHFPWLPSRCKHCDKWGHTEEVCAAKRKDSGKEIERNEEITQQQELNKVLETERSMVTTKQLMINNGEEMPLLQLRNKVVGSAEAECVEEATL
ncbi:hypothetical protein Bca4012_032040 [Brassica carinata]